MPKKFRNYLQKQNQNQKQELVNSKVVSQHIFIDLTSAKGTDAEFWMKHKGRYILWMITSIQI